MRGGWAIAVMGLIFAILGAHVNSAAAETTVDVYLTVQLQDAGTTTTTTLPSTECIIDNKDALSDKYYRELYGRWLTGSAGTAIWDPADPAADYRRQRARPGVETARAEWVCMSLPAGSYEVFAWWPVLKYRMGQNVAYEVHHADGVTTVRKYQGLNGGQWNSLGTYTFDAGSHVVQIHNGEAGPGMYVVADAVRFVSVAAP